MGPGPLWRRAPLRMLAEGPWASLLVLAFLLCAVAAAADVLSVSAWRTASVQRVVQAVPDGAGPRVAPVLRVSATPSPGPRLSSLREQVDDIPGMSDSQLLGVSFLDELEGSRLERYDGFVGSGDRRRDGRLVAVEDPASRLVVTAAASSTGRVVPDGLWLPAPVAADLGVDVGDRIEVGNELSRGEDTLAVTTLAGTYEPAASGDRPADVDGSSFWAERAGRLPGDRTGSGEVALLVGEPTTVQLLEARIGDLVVWTLDSRLDPPVPTRTELGRTAGGVVALQRSLGAQGVTGSGGMLPTTAVSGVPGLAQAADDITRRAAAEARTPAIGSIVLGLALLLAVSALTASRRHRELELLAGLGVRPPAVGALAALEVGPAALLGCVAGVPVALLVVRGLAGVPPEPGALRLAVTQAGVVVLLGVVLHALVSTLAAAAAARRGARHHRAQRALPWRSALVVSAVAATAGLLAAPVGEARGLDLSVPVLVAAAVGALGATALRALAAGRAPRPAAAVRTPAGAPATSPLAPRAVGAMVVRRRLAAGGSERLVVVTALATAFGLAAHVVVGEELVRRAVQDKAAVLAGADLVVDLDHATQLDPDLPEDGYTRDIALPAGETAVWRDGGRLPGDRPVDVVVVDVSTFEQAASWGAVDGRLQRSRQALPALARADTEATPPCPSRSTVDLLVPEPEPDPDDPPPPECPPRPAEGEGTPEGRVAGGPAPVLLVGDPAGLDVGDGTSLVGPNGPVPLEVVGVVEAFPGIDPDLRTGVVAATGSYLPRLPGGDPRFAGTEGTPYRDVDGVELWTDRPLADVAARLRADGVAPEVLEDERRFRAASEVAVRPAFVAVDLVSPYLLALAALVLLVAVLALCLSVDRAAVRARAGDVVLARIGLGRVGTRRLLLVEALVLVVAGLGLGALGWALTVPLLPRLLEPEPAVGPLLVGAPVPWVALPLLAAALLAVLAGALVVRAGRGARTEEEVLRAQD